MLDPAFDATHVATVGIAVDSTVTVDGTPRSGNLPSSGEATLQIDTVSE